MSKQPTVASLFAGIGGIDLGFKLAGFDLAWANEIDRKACTTYYTNFSQSIICDDIKHLDHYTLSPVDVLTAGFPCQAFSIAGYRKGFDDDRGSVFFDLIRVVKEIKPKVLLLENVKNILSHNHGQTFATISDTLHEMGYHLTHKLMNTCDYSNIPQNRERVYIVCFLDKNQYTQFRFPNKTNQRLSILDLVEPTLDDPIFYYTQTKYYPILKDMITNRHTCYQWRRKYVRENKRNLCPTLTANMGTGGHNVPLILDQHDIRKLTPRECDRFQGFPDEFILPDGFSNATLYKQIGNSVSVPVIRAIANQLMAVLKS